MTKGHIEVPLGQILAFWDYFCRKNLLMRKLVFARKLKTSIIIDNTIFEISDTIDHIFHNWYYEIKRSILMVNGIWGGGTTPFFL